MQGVFFSYGSGIGVEVQRWPDDRRCLRAVQSLSDQFCLLGDGGVSDPPLLSAAKITNWGTCLEVLSWIIDTESFTVTLPSPKRLKLRVIRSEWPPSWACASAKQVFQRVVFLMQVSFAFRPGSFLLHHILASVGLSRIVAGAKMHVEWSTLVGMSFSGPTSAGTSSSGAHVSAKGWMRWG